MCCILTARTVNHPVVSRLDLENQRPLVLEGYTWEQYLSLDELFQDSGVRVRYLDHHIEIMPPISESHEEKKSNLGRLLEAWCLDHGVEFWARGSMTLTKLKEAGGEPDECYHFRTKKEYPDLAIEVALTSGGLSKRAFYAKFPIPELWIWRGGALEVWVFHTESGGYDRRETSEVLPGIDLAALARCATIERTSEAIRAFRREVAG